MVVRRRLRHHSDVMGTSHNTQRTTRSWTSSSRRRTAKCRRVAEAAAEAEAPAELPWKSRGGSSERRRGKPCSPEAQRRRRLSSKTHAKEYDLLNSIIEDNVGYCEDAVTDGCTRLNDKSVRQNISAYMCGPFTNETSAWVMVQTDITSMSLVSQMVYQVSARLSVLQQLSPRAAANASFALLSSLFRSSSTSS